MSKQSQLLTHELLIVAIGARLIQTPNAPTCREAIKGPSINTRSILHSLRRHKTQTPRINKKGEPGRPR